MVADEMLRLGLSNGTIAAFMDLVAEVASTANDPGEVTQEFFDELVADLRWFIHQPRLSWGFQYGLPVRTLNIYVLAQISALRVIVAKPGQWPVAHYEDSHLKRLRAAVDPDQ